jgi:hypothetical protein
MKTDKAKCVKAVTTIADENMKEWGGEPSPSKVPYSPSQFHEKAFLRAKALGCNHAEAIEVANSLTISLGTILAEDFSEADWEKAATPPPQGIDRQNCAVVMNRIAPKMTLEHCDSPLSAHEFIYNESKQMECTHSEAILIATSLVATISDMIHDAQRGIHSPDPFGADPNMN